jgi:predicted PurR-regulated permease PerM
MRFVKLALISAVVLFIVIYLFSLIIPSTVRVSRAVNISAPKDSLVAQLADLRQWHYWNDMANNPENTNKKFTENAITSEQMTVTKTAQMGDTLLTDWQQQNARVLNSGFTWYGDDGQLVLQWYFDIKLRWYPWEKFGSIVFDKQLGPPMEKSLGNLKKLLEKNP